MSDPATLLALVGVIPKIGRPPPRPEHQIPETASILPTDAGEAHSPTGPGPVRPREVTDRLLTHGTLIQAAARKAIFPKRQRELGQYFTPMWVARLMASMMPPVQGSVRVLDPGASAGTLFTA